MLGIIILNYNTPYDVIDCVDSIIKTTESDYHIYIVDNRSTDNSYELLKSELSMDCITIIQANENGGFSAGNNIGIRKAIEDGCELILVSNPDVIYFERTIDTMVEDICQNPKVGAVGPSTPSLDEAESQLLRKIYDTRTFLCSKKPLWYVSKIVKQMKTEYTYPDYETNPLFCFPGMVRGCCFIMKSKVFEKIGLFDEHVFLYSEEWIIAKKLQRQGLLCGFDNRIKALHKEATSTKQSGSAFQSYHLYLSSFYYMKYYSDAGKLWIRFFYLQNICNYLLKSILDKQYRALFRKFVREQNKLLKVKNYYIR